jgi:RNA polymerase sigma-70 factor, ECF subfamily
MTEPDEALLVRIAAGDEAALACFYDRHAPRLYGLLRKVLECRDDADDALQLVFVQVWRTASQYDATRGGVKGWLVLIARSRARDLRRRARHAEQMSPLGVCDVSDPAVPGDKRHQDSRLHRALAQVPAEQRAAIDLAFFHGMTYQEVAQHQTLPLGTVKTRIRSGLQRLRDLLTREGYA